MISEGSCDTEDWSNDAENSPIQMRMTVTAAVISVLKRKCFLLLVKIGQSDRTAFTENGTAGKMDTVKMDKNY